MKNILFIVVLVVSGFVLYSMVRSPQLERELDAQIRHEENLREMGRFVNTEPWFESDRFCHSLVMDAAWLVDQCLYKKNMAEYKKIKRKYPELIKMGKVEYPIIGLESRQWQDSQIKK